MADVLTSEQEQAAKKFIEIVNLLRKHRCVGPLSWSSALKFMFARKFDVQRAYALYEQHELTRYREGLVDLDPNREPLRSELLTGKFTILPTRDGTGAAIALFRAHMHYPHLTSHQTTLQGVVYQLDVALENPETQRNGLVFIYDMSDSKYSNFDYELSQKILTLLKGGYPAKLKKVLIVTAPLWFKAPFKILRLFVREKLRDRVYTISIPQLPIHIPRESLPRTLGGELEISHSAWLQVCAATTISVSGSSSMTNPRHDEDPPSPLIISNPPPPASPELAKIVGQSLVSQSPQPQAVLAEESSTADHDPEGRAEPSSSASSGFSDDDSLHCEGVGGGGGGGGAGGLTIDQFVHHVRMKSRKGLVEEYAEIRQRPPDGTFTVARQSYNQSKNRYTDVLCYDHTRVLLSVENNDPTTDYINANYVDGYKQRNAFISTQGPLPKTTNDFWRMVWEQQCLVIVMATKVEERGKTKCHQYWPLAPSADDDTTREATYGAIRVTNQKVDRESAADFTVTHLHLLNTKTEEEREVCHFQFTSWPDYGTPHSACAMLDCLRRVRSTQARLLAALGDTWAGHSRGPPILVHCSAGIGRTGTFCTVDICISRLEDTGTVDVRGTVQRMRQQRAYCIQMPDQYIFCHLAVIEHALAHGLIQADDIAQLDIVLSADRDSD